MPIHATLLPDGRLLTFGTTRGGAPTGRFVYDVWDPSEGLRRGHLTLPNGTATDIFCSAASVLPLSGEVLIAGGGDDYGSGASGAYVIDINGPVPTVTPTASMPQGLHWHDAVILADGRVAVIGGSRMGEGLAGVNTTPFIWDPATGRWTTGAASRSRRARLYHSTALLLPDALGLVGGGGAVGPQTSLDAEIWWPPYLYDGNGNRARRPRILEAPRAAEVGERLAIRVDDPARIARVTLLRTGSVTHSFDMGQRFTELRFARTGRTLQVALPRNPGVLPPGGDMLFVLDAAGVPSTASLLQIRVSATPAARVSWTPSYGAGQRGMPATAACPAGQVVVGAEGTADTRLRRLAPLCVAVPEDGRWAGRPALGTAVGRDGGEPFRRLCPEGSAVVGIRGRAGAELERLALQCRALDDAQRARGESTWLAPVGGRGGIGRPAYSCTTGRAGTAFYTRIDRSITALGLDCRRRPSC